MEEIRQSGGDLVAMPPAELRAALAGVDAGTAMALVARAGSFGEQAQLLRHLPTRVRLAVLDALPAESVAALIQNCEAESLWLLGQISFEQFRRLMERSNPQWQLWWLERALADPTSRSFGFPLALPAAELARALLSEPAFAAHVRAMGDYPVWDLRVSPEAMRDPLAALLVVFGGEGLLREFPLPEGPARTVAAALLERHPEFYLEVVRAALAALDYAATHPEEEVLLSEEPVWLRPEEIAAAPAAPPEPATPAPVLPLPVALPDALVPWLASLGPARRHEVDRELHALLLREAVAAGGSFLVGDLERIAARQAALLRIGAAALAGEGPEALAAALADHSVSDLIERGARAVEQLRQVALRLEPFHRVLDLAQRRLVASLRQPDVTLDRERRQPVILVAGAAGTEALACEEVRSRLQEAAAWVEVARMLTFRRAAGAIAATEALPPVAAGLALGAILMGRVEFGLAEAEEVTIFRRRYCSARTGRVLPRARAALRRAAEAVSAERGVPLAALITTLERGLEHLAALIAAHREDDAAVAAACYLALPPEVTEEADDPEFAPLGNEP